MLKVQEALLSPSYARDLMNHWTNWVLLYFTSKRMASTEALPPYFRIYWKGERGSFKALTQLQKSRKQFASRQKRSQTLNPGNCLGYTLIFIDLSFICYKITVYQNFSIKQIKAMYSKMTCHKICLNLSLKTVSVHIFCGVDVMNCETCYEYRITWSGTSGQSNHNFYNKILTVRHTMTISSIA